MSELQFNLVSDITGEADKGAKPDASAVYDTLILGGGPAAMAAAVYCSRKAMELAVIADEFGGQIADTSAIENYLGFQMIQGRELADKFLEHMKGFDIPCATGEKAVEVAKGGDMFSVTLEGGTVYRSHTVVFATGRRYRPLGVPGEKELTGRGVSYCTICDAPFFKKKRVVVAGGGNSAFTAAFDLLQVAAVVTLVNIVEGWQADPVLRRPVEEDPKARLLDRHRFVRIEGERKVAAAVVEDLASGDEKRIEADGVFVEIGGIPNSDPVKDLAKLTAGGELVIDCGCATSVPGLFGAGDVTTVPYKQIVISAGEGAKAGLSAYAYLRERGMP
ncbi:MAG: FAD-dependent oxidoreductase [Planctomycetota bacterium]